MGQGSRLLFFSGPDFARAPYCKPKGLGGLLVVLLPPPPLVFTDALGVQVTKGLDLVFMTSGFQRRQQGA